MLVAFRGERTEVFPGLVSPSPTLTSPAIQGRIPETTLHCIQHLRHAMPRCTISVEIEKPGRAGLTELAAAADVVFYSRSWAEVSLYPTVTSQKKRKAHSLTSCSLVLPHRAEGTSRQKPVSGVKRRRPKRE